MGADVQRTRDVRIEGPHTSLVGWSTGEVSGGGGVEVRGE